MVKLFANNPASTLLSGITNVVTSLTVQAGDGAEFPSPTGGDSFRCTLEDAGGLMYIVRINVVAPSIPYQEPPPNIDDILLDLGMGIK